MGGKSYLTQEQYITRKDLIWQNVFEIWKEFFSAQNLCITTRNVLGKFSFNLG